MVEKTMSMTNGQVVRASGTSIQTLRYYERERLLQAQARKLSGYRVYRPEAVARLRFIRRAKAWDFRWRRFTNF
jgi:MerR family copper efflux transcriptional regulator